MPTNGYSNVRMSDKETAKRLVANALNKGDSLERSCALANMLRTSKPDMQYEILSFTEFTLYKRRLSTSNKLYQED